MQLTFGLDIIQTNLFLKLQSENFLNKWDYKVNFKLLLLIRNISFYLKS